MDFSLLNKNHPLVYSLKKRLLLSLMLSLVIAFILIFLKPFDTGEKYLPYKNLMLAGYGFCVMAADMSLISLERLWTFRLKKTWTLGTEILYLIALFLTSSTMVYLYDLLITKQAAVEWDYIVHFSYQFTVPFALLLLPLLTYVRLKYGEKRTPEQLFNPTIVLTGQNKDDQLEISLQQLLFIKAEDNYVRIVFIDKDSRPQEILMRNTLAAMAEQAPSLVYCHRSYLVAHWHVIELFGHKQKANLILEHYSKEVPLSSAHYASIKKLTKL